jgi:TonB family protein
VPVRADLDAILARELALKPRRKPRYTWEFMSLHQVHSAFNLLGQVQEPAEYVPLPGPAEPKLVVSWGGFSQGVGSNLAAVLSGPTWARDYVYKGFFKDGWIEGRVPRLAILVALGLHVGLVLIPFPRWLTEVRHNPAFDNTELTWSGPIEDLPLLNLPSTLAKAAPHAKSIAETRTGQPNDASAFHPRQRIFTDAAHPTHPRQTLINPAAPVEAPKILPNLPNIVQMQQAAQPARPRVQIDPQALAKLHPRERRAATSEVAAPSDVPVFQQQQEELTIQATGDGPARPKLALNTGAAPRVAQRTQAGDPSTTATAPELSDARTSSGGSSPSTLIALSATPAPPAAVVPVPQGNLSARVAIAPEGKPGAAGVANGSAATGEKTSAAGGSSNSAVAVSISGGSATPKNTMSGLGGAGSASGGAAGKSPTKLALLSPHDMLTHRPTQAEANETQARSGPPNFAALAPGAKPETLLGGKKIYTLFVNMPNLNSTTGSWVLNFSELRTDGLHVAAGNLAAPVPARKVDPKYPPTLAADRVEGEIVLYAVIRKDGSVDSVQVVRGLDEVLDANSMTALSQWKFHPATRENEPVELEAIVHIPFHAARKE